MIHRGFRAFVVDLRSCELMDSTFMGTLAGIALRLREMGQGSLQVINVNERNGSLLGNLGLDHLFDVKKEGDPSTPPPPAEQTMTSPPADADVPSDTHSTVLSAHEALVEADAENAARFRDVLEYLKQQTPSDQRD